jgi:hypothetical protein
MFLGTGLEQRNLRLLHHAMRHAEVYLEDADTIAALEPLAAAYMHAGQKRTAQATIRRAIALSAMIHDKPTRLRLERALAQMLGDEGGTESGSGAGGAEGITASPEYGR